MCFSTRKKPACIVGILSAVILATAIAMIALSINFTGADIFKAFKDEDGEVNKLADVMFYILASISVVVLIVGFCGLCLMRCNNKCCPIVFGVCLLPTWVSVFIFGCVVAWFSNSSPSTIQEFCTDTEHDSMFINWGRDLVKDYDKDIGQMVNSLMCSKECPCPPVSNKNKWLSIPEYELNEIGRTGLKISTQGYTEFDFSGEGNIIYRKFSDCYRDIQSGNTSMVQPEKT